ncbi:MAG: hypothetical protein K2N82_13765 [Lachnospiraceae bacterium]|nr:hypothetical protein [Lachnospiraceae bacterium]
MRYYSSVQGCSFTANNIPHLVKLQEEFGLTPEMITSHFDWLEIIRQNAYSYDDAKPFILKMLGI